MIAKVFQGNNLSELIAYVYREDKNPEVVASSCGALSAASALSQLGGQIGSHDQGLKRPVAHVTLSLPPGEELDRRGWREVVERVTKALHLDKNAYVALKHHDTGHAHVHIVASRVTPEGRAAVVDFPYYRVQEVLREVERDLDLTRVRSSHELQREDYRPLPLHEIKREARTGEPSQKRLIQEALRHSDQEKDPLAWREQLEARGVAVRFRVQEGVITGVSYAREGVSVAGSSLGKAASFSGLAANKGFDDPAAQRLLLTPAPERHGQGREALRPSSERAVVAAPPPRQAPEKDPGLAELDRRLEVLHERQAKLTQPQRPHLPEPRVLPTSALKRVEPVAPPRPAPLPRMHPAPALSNRTSTADETSTTRDVDPRSRGDAPLISSEALRASSSEWVPGQSELQALAQGYLEKKEALAASEPAQEAAPTRQAEQERRAPHADLSTSTPSSRPVDEGRVEPVRQVVDAPQREEARPERVVTSPQEPSTVADGSQALPTGPSADEIRSKMLSYIERNGYVFVSREQPMQQARYRGHQQDASGDVHVLLLGARRGDGATPCMILSLSQVRQGVEQGVDDPSQAPRFVPCEGSALLQRFDGISKYERLDWDPSQGMLLFKPAARAPEPWSPQPVHVTPASPQTPREHQPTSAPRPRITAPAPVAQQVNASSIEVPKPPQNQPRNERSRRVEGERPGTTARSETPPPVQLEYARGGKQMSAMLREMVEPRPDRVVSIPHKTLEEVRDVAYQQERATWLPPDEAKPQRESVRCTMLENDLHLKEGRFHLLADRQHRVQLVPYNREYEVWRGKDVQLEVPARGVIRVKEARHVEAKDVRNDRPHQAQNEAPKRQAHVEPSPKVEASKVQAREPEPERLSAYCKRMKRELELDRVELLKEFNSFKGTLLGPERDVTLREGRFALMLDTRRNELRLVGYRPEIEAHRGEPVEMICKAGGALRVISMELDLGR